MFFTLLDSCKEKINEKIKPAPYAVDIKIINEVSENFQTEMIAKINENKKNAKISGNDAITEKKEIDTIDKKNNAKGELTLYVINYKKNSKNESGYLFVSADSRVEPILAFSETDKYDITNPGLKIMELYLIEQIDKIRESKKNQEPREKSAWEKYGNSGKRGRSNSSTLDCQPWYPNYPNCCPPDYESIDGPNFHSDWHQDLPYNLSCEYNGCTSSGHANAGCGPIATAQLVNYYTLPATRARFGITGSNKPVISNPFPFPFTNFAQNDVSTNAVRCSELIKLMGTYGNTNYNFMMQCTALTPRANIVSIFNSCGYSSQGNRISYTNYNNSIAIYNEVKSGRPVIMDGTTGPLNFSNWHIWAIDGYREKQWSTISNGQCYTYGSQMYHHNWGWKFSNGTWCTKFDIISPYGTYDSNLNATIGIRP